MILLDTNVISELIRPAPRSQSEASRRLDFINRPRETEACRLVQQVFDG